MTINFKKLDPRAVLPTKGTPGSAAYDLTATRITTETNEVGQVVVVYHTDIVMEIPEGYYGDVRPRSSISKKPLRMCNSCGVVDSDFRGEITAKFNTTTDVIPAVYKEGEKFAQLIITKCEDVEFNEVTELSNTERGEGSYGSTDTNESADTVLSGPSEEKEISINPDTAPGQAAEQIDSSEVA